MRKALGVGKLPTTLLEGMLKTIAGTDSRLLVGPSVGEDAAVIDFGDRCLVAKTDPITFAAERIGWYAVHVNANDIATMGARPRWFLAAVLLPEGRADEAMAETIFEDIRSACGELQVTLCGGHTEITHDLPRPVIVGHMLGEVTKDKLVRGADATPDDIILLTKGIAVEGTALLAREKAGELLAHFDAAFLGKAKHFLTDPGISVVREALTACDAGGVHAMHDPTEGGLATGLWELAHLANAGLEIEEAAIPVFPECRAICEHLDLDPLGVIASGALLIAVEPGSADRVCAALNDIGISCHAIGRLTSPEGGMKMRTATGWCDLPRFDVDEVARVF